MYLGTSECYQTGASEPMPPVEPMEPDPGVQMESSPHELTPE